MNEVLQTALTDQAAPSADTSPARHLARSIFAKTPEGLKACADANASGERAQPITPKSLELRIQQFLSEKDPNQQNDDRLGVILQRLSIAAANGDVKATQVLLDRAYGKPKQEINIKPAQVKDIFSGAPTEEEAAQMYKELVKRTE